MGWGPQEDADSIAAIHEALDCGVNWIDTAHAYGFGKSEEVVGRALKEWSGGVIIATKCGVLPNEVRFPYRDANREKIFEEVEGSLKRLQVDCIDLYQLHWPELDEKVEGSPQGESDGEHVPLTMLIPMLILAAGVILLGLFNGVVISQFIDPAIPTGLPR